MEAIKSYQMRLMLLTEAVMRSLLGNFLSHFCNFSQRVPKVYFLDTAKFANDNTFADQNKKFSDPEELQLPSCFIFQI